MTFLPSNRLLVLVCAAIPLAVLAGPLPGLTGLWLSALAAILVVASADLAWSLRAARPPGISVPPVMRFSKDRAGTLPVTFTNEGGSARRLRFALGLPAVFSDEKTDVHVELPAGARQSCIQWSTTPSRRGRFSGILACCETVSVFGLWMLRERRMLECELRVYPNLFSERKQLAAIFLDRGQAGAKAMRMVGRGRDFEKLRDYLPGDGFDEIQWKATAKRGRPITKVFQAERTQEIYVVIDRSRLSAREVMHEGVVQTALERCITAALVLLLAAERQGDRFGLLVYDDRARAFIRAGSGASHYGACREALHGLQPSETTPDMAEIVRYLRTQLRRRALLFFLTDLSDPVLAEDFAKHAPLLAKQHLMLVNQLRAPGVAAMFSGAEVQGADEVYARLSGHLRWTEARALAQMLKPLGITVTLLEDETLAAQLVTQYLRVKRRQLL